MIFVLFLKRNYERVNEKTRSVKKVLSARYIRDKRCWCGWEQLGSLINEKNRSRDRPSRDSNPELDVCAAPVSGPISNTLESLNFALAADFARKFTGHLGNFGQSFANVLWHAHLRWKEKKIEFNINHKIEVVVWSGSDGRWPVYQVKVQPNEFSYDL